MDGGIEERAVQQDLFYVENYEIRIETLEYGYVLAVGCKRFAITDKETLLSMLTKYINNPAELQKQYQNKTLIISK
jgi:hypothetical protein